MKTRRKLCNSLALGCVILCAGLSLGQSADTAAAGFKQLREMTAEKLPAGMVDYARYCSSCHGSEGKGDGLNAFNIKTRPRDFTDTAAMRGKTPGSVRKVIWAGGAANNLSIDMPMWGKTLDSVSVDNLTRYVLFLSGKH